MPVLPGLAGGSPSKAVALEIYASLVDALYDVKNSLFIGSFAASLAALLTAWKSGEPVLFAFAAAIAIVAWLRMRDMSSYARSRASLETAKEFRRWEHRYVFGAAIYVAILSSWTLAAFIITEDPFVRLFSFSVTLAYMIGISGRNFASDLLVTSQIVCAGAPLSVALFVAGGFYYAVFALVILPFFAGLRLISNRLRQTLLNAVNATTEITELAHRFDTALNNMPQGLCMFDREHRLVVANRHVVDLLGVLPEDLAPGRSAREIFTGIIVSDASGPEAETLISNFEQRLLRSGECIYAEARQERTLALTTQPMDDGGVVVVIEDITERRNSEAKINRLAHFDSLTGLPNRNHFSDKLDAAMASMRRDGPLAIQFIDLDGFKQVNDTLGHQCGDELLSAVSSRIRELMRPSDVVARFGGDEFVVLQTPVGSAAEAERLAQRVVEKLSEPYVIESNQIVIGACVGIALAPRDGAIPDRLLKNADMALYHAKEMGRSTWRFFLPEMDVELQELRTLELDLRKALENDEFELYFQPIIDIRTMRITTCEALVRWRHPKRGLVPPMEFIPVAEQMGLIIEIGAWVLKQACLECLTWPAEVNVAVNLSATQFRRDEISELVPRVLEETGLPATRLELEITETILMENLDAARKTLRRLSDLGIGISLDDFGTGYSSLSYLHSFPLHKVKIDRSFVKNIRRGQRSQTLLRGIANLSADLGLTVVVEGIETDDQLTLVLEEKSVDEVQGFLFSVPIPSQQMAELLIAACGRGDEKLSTNRRALLSSAKVQAL